MVPEQLLVSGRDRPQTRDELESLIRAHFPEDACDQPPNWAAMAASMAD